MDLCLVVFYSFRIITFSGYLLCRTGKTKVAKSISAPLTYLFPHQIYVSKASCYLPSNTETVEHFPSRYLGIAVVLSPNVQPVRKRLRYFMLLRAFNSDARNPGLVLSIHHVRSWITARQRHERSMAS